MAPSSSSKTRHGRIRVGVGGWIYAPWRGAFYPSELAQRRELEYASRHLSTLEINSTYYGAQRPESFTRWHDETPEDFVFSLKAPRFAMNRRVLAEAGATIERFLSGGVLNLRDKLGPINWQITPGKRFDPEDYARFLELLPDEAEGRPLRHALEVRDASFCTPEFVALARKHKAAIVVSGDSSYPLIGDASAPFVYARIMGTAQEHPQGYPPPTSTFGRGVRSPGRAANPRTISPPTQSRSPRRRAATCFCTSSVASRNATRRPPWG